MIFVGLTVCIIKTTEVLSMSSWISRHDVDDFDRRLLQMLWTNRSMAETNFCEPFYHSTTINQTPIRHKS